MRLPRGRVDTAAAQDSGRDAAQAAIGLHTRPGATGGLCHALNESLAVHGVVGLLNFAAVGRHHFKHRCAHLPQALLLKQLRLPALHVKHQQRADVDAVSVGVEEQHHTFVAQRWLLCGCGVRQQWICGLVFCRRCHPQRLRQQPVLRMLRHAHRAGVPGVQRLALQCQHRLAARVAHGTHRGQRRVALHQQQFGAGTVLAAVFQLGIGGAVTCIHKFIVAAPARPFAVALVNRMKIAGKGSPMSITNTEALTRVIEHREIFHDEMLALMRRIMNGEMSPVMISALAMGLRVKKETVGEIAAAAQVMREFATPVLVADRTHLVDIVGTGGDGSHTFNISTASMFVAAAAGARVAKHAGRSVSSTSGSADVMEALGANIMLSPEQVAQCLEQTGIAYMFAPNHHTAMKHAAPVRKELGVRTLFNILGPLTNPAGAPHQLLGVFHPDLVGILVRVLQRLGSEHVMVVYGMNGMDELSLSGETAVGELKGGEVREYVVHPSDFGLPVYDSRVLKVANKEESVQFIERALGNENGPVRDVVLLNAGAALYCADMAPSVIEGVRLAREAVASGAALAKLSQFVSATQALGGR